MADPRPAYAEARASTRKIWLLAFFLAVIVWYAVRAATRFDTVVTDVPIEIQSDEGWAVLDRSAETANVRFQGSRSDVRDLDRSRVQIVIDARGQAAPGYRTVRIRTGDVRSSAPVRATLVRPDSLTFSLDREGERSIPVRVEYQGALPDGYEVDQTACSPATVTVRGPMQWLDAAEVIRTAPIDLDGRVQTFQVRRPLVAPQGLETVRMTPDRVQVEVSILEHAANHTVTGVPILLLTPPSVPAPELLSPGTVSVELQGRADVVRGLDAGRVRAFVDCAGALPSGEIELPVSVHVAPGVRLVSVKPSAVRVRFRGGGQEEERK
jgi:YbbR domain-containing protein